MNWIYYKLSVKISIWTLLQGESKKGDVGFFNPKNVTIGSGVDQNKKSPSFLPIYQKMLILHENLEFLMPGENFPLKKVNF